MPGAFQLTAGLRPREMPRFLPRGPAVPTDRNYRIVWVGGWPGGPVCGRCPPCPPHPALQGLRNLQGGRSQTFIVTWLSGRPEANNKGLCSPHTAHPDRPLRPPSPGSCAEGRGPERPNPLQWARAPLLPSFPLPLCPGAAWEVGLDHNFSPFPPGLEAGNHRNMWVEDWQDEITGALFELTTG